MKGYWIDAAERTIKEIEWTDQSFQVMFEGGPTIGAIFENGDVLYVDDEGLLHPATLAFRVRRRPDGQPIMSNGFLIGPHRGQLFNGEFVESNLDPEMTIEDLQAEIEWLTVEEALAWFHDHADKPAAFINGCPVTLWGEFLENLEGRD